MEHKHLDAAALDRLLATDRTTEQNEQLFHLLAVCPVCREVGGWLLELHQSKALAARLRSHRRRPGPLPRGSAPASGRARALGARRPPRPPPRRAPFRELGALRAAGPQKLPGRAGAGRRSPPPRRPGRPRGRQDPGG